METELLYQVLANVRPLSDGLWDAILRCLKEDHLTRDVLVVRSGMVVSRVWFLNHGFARGFRQWNDEEQTLWFAKKGELFTADHSFFKQHPSDMSVMIYKGSRVLSMGLDDLLQLRNEVYGFDRIYTTLLERYHLQEQERNWSLRHDSPAKKVAKLFKEYPQVLQYALPAQVASYLGISRATLYRHLK